MTNLEKLDLLSDVQKELEQTRRERDEYRDEYTRLAASAAVIDAARNNAVARAEQAERERDAERLAREGAQQHRREAETRLREATERNLELIAARERAEVERDEARRIHAANVDAGEVMRREFKAAGVVSDRDGVLVIARGVLGRMLRAEAANAALLAMFKDAVFAMNHACDTLNAMDAVDEEEDAEAIAAVGRVTSAMERIERGDYPGAALLEYVRELESVMEAASRVATGANTRSAWDALDEALTAVNAPKGTP